MTSRTSVYGGKMGGHLTPRQTSADGGFDSPGGLDGLNEYELRGPTKLSNNPLLATGSGSRKNRDKDKSIELQQLSGSNSIHPMLVEYKAEAESWWTKNFSMHRGVMISCAVLSIILTGMVAMEVNAVFKDSYSRQAADVDAQRWEEGGCHWSQIRLPSSLSANSVSVQVDLQQPPTPYSEIGNYARLGEHFSYCFMVFTQGTTAVITSTLTDTSESGVVKPTSQNGVYLMFFKDKLADIEQHATLRMDFEERSPAQGAGEEIACWKECIEYDSVCEEDLRPARRSLTQYHSWMHALHKECSEITTCDDQKIAHHCGWCQTGTSITAGHGIPCKRDETLPDTNCIPAEHCGGFWTWQSGACPKVGNGVCVLKVICTRYKTTCVGFHDLLGGQT